jgi:tetratricopeptide (TPR) repeat protein
VLLLLVSAGLVAGGYLGWRWLANRLERRRALELLVQNQFDESEPLLLRAFARNPDDLEVVKALALKYARGNRFPEAEPFLTRWCELQPSEVEPFTRRMNLYNQLAQRERALADGRHILEIDPENDTNRERVASLALSVGQFAEAEREFQYLLGKQPNDLKVRYWLAEVYFNQGAYDKAQALVSSLLHEDPLHQDALALQGFLYYRTNQPKEAIPILRKVLTLDPERQKTARYYLGLSLERTGQVEEARKVLAEMQRLQDADRLYEDSKLQPDNLPLHVQAAEAVLNIGKTKEGLKLLEKVLARDPTHAAAHRVLASYYEKQGDLALAAEHRRQAEK